MVDIYEIKYKTVVDSNTIHLKITVRAITLLLHYEKSITIRNSPLNNQYLP